MAAVVWRGDAPELHETHLLAWVGGSEELDLGWEEGGDVDAMAGEDDFCREDVSCGSGCRAGLLVWDDVRRVVVVLCYRIGDCIFWLRGLVDRGWWEGSGNRLEGEVAREESS